MFNFMVTSDGSLTGAGYVICIVGMILLLIIGALLASKNTKKSIMSAKQLVFCAAAIALAFLTSYVKVSMPFGGSVTLFSMLFIVLIANWYGTKTGIMVGLAYGILQFIQEPYVLSFFQVCCDYILAFAALGLAGIFRNQKNGLLKGYLFAIFMRGVFHVIGGYLYWMSYMPDNFPKSLSAVYPIVYNYSYIILEGIATVVLISIPAVKKALAEIKRVSFEGEAFKRKTAA